MRKVVLYQLLSLDGVAEEPGDWMFDAGEAVFENLGQIIATQDDILLGRATYDYWVDFWPTSDVEPFASFINGTPKHVITSSKPTQEWPNSIFVNQPPVPYVTDLKQGAGRDIGIHGSIRLAQTLLRADLVNEVRLVVAPALANRGKRLFDDSGSDLRELALIDSDCTSGGALLLAYQVETG